MSHPFLNVACATAFLLAAPTSWAQQAWPSKPIIFVVPYAAGGFVDIRARKIGAELTKALGQPVVIENKVGAGGVLGTDVVAKAAPDGYTIGSGNFAPLAVNVTLMKKLPYDPATDIAPVFLIEPTVPERSWMAAAVTVMPAALWLTAPTIVPVLTMAPTLAP